MLRPKTDDGTEGQTNVSPEIKPLTYGQTKHLLEDFNRSDRTRVLKRTEDRITFEKPDRSLSVDDFGRTD